MVVAGFSSLLSRGGKLADDAAFAIFYLAALALGILLLGRAHDPEAVQARLFGSTTALDAAGLVTRAWPRAPP